MVKQSQKEKQIAVGLLSCFLLFVSAIAAAPDTHLNQFDEGPFIFTSVPEPLSTSPIGEEIGLEPLDPDAEPIIRSIGFMHASAVTYSEPVSDALPLGVRQALYRPPNI